MTTVPALLSAIRDHGYSILCALVFIESIGAPVPAALALLVAGALSAHGPLRPVPAFLLAVSAILLGDTLMFFLGRFTGWWLLGVLCRVSLNPEACILRSAQTFYRRGRLFLLMAKFVPGVNTIAPPMAGSMNMRFSQFFSLDIAGALLYVGAYFGAGFVFSGLLASITNSYETFSAVIVRLLLLALLSYVGYRLWFFFKSRKLSPVPRVAPSDVATRLYSAGDSNLRVFDVRSHGYYDKGAQRIRGSLRLEPNALPRDLKALSKEKDIVLYCTCVRQATSIRVARILQEHGFQPWVIDGGLKSWMKAGLPLETVPEEDVVLLPTFS